MPNFENTPVWSEMLNAAMRDHKSTESNRQMAVIYD